MSTLPDGYGFVGPRGRKTVQALLDAAVAAGFPTNTVSTRIDGYIAPVEVVKEYEKALGGGDTAEDQGPVAPDMGWKVAEIKEWADTHNVDLGDATKKADMLSAISAATKEE